MAWFDSFQAMQSADLDSTFLGGEFSSAAVVLHTAGGDEYALTGISVSRKSASIAKGQNHISDDTLLEVLLPTVPAVGQTYSPRRGDWIEFDGGNWDYLQLKGADAGTVTVLFKQVGITEFTNGATQL